MRHLQKQQQRRTNLLWLQCVNVWEGTFQLLFFLQNINIQYITIYLCSAFLYSKWHLQISKLFSSIHLYVFSQKNSCVQMYVCMYVLNEAIEIQMHFLQVLQISTRCIFRNTYVCIHMYVCMNLEIFRVFNIISLLKYYFYFSPFNKLK